MGMVDSSMLAGGAIKHSIHQSLLSQSNADVKYHRRIFNFMLPEIFHHDCKSAITNIKIGTITINID